MESVDEIWTGDLFDRKSEAEAFIGYLESVATRPPMRDEGHAHVLAVDTSYGQGKSFFLRRLARHMRADEHAVAFVDAWVDDLEDQPMVALVATLDKALEPWTSRNPGLADKMADFRSRAGRVAKIVGVGIAKRAASFVIMSSGAEALGDEMAGASDTVKDLAKDTLKDGGTGIIDDIASGFGARMASSMERRIERFREGQQAISDMKTGLSDIVDQLSDAGIKLPITIIIDELDRCRPTYAIKVLEEVKHLFDVPGIAFVLGLHGKQLAHSISAAYGVGFDSQAYLRRFFNRRYILKDVQLTPLVSKLATDLGISEKRLRCPSISENARHQSIDKPMSEIISDYIDAYGLAARDAFAVMEMLQTVLALTGPGQIIVPLILPMIIAHIKDVEVSKLEIMREPSWGYIAYDHRTEKVQVTITNIKEMFDETYSASKMPPQEIMNLMNRGVATHGTELVAEVRFDRSGGLVKNDPADYERVLRTVARFVSP